MSVLGFVTSEGFLGRVGTLQQGLCPLLWPCCVRGCVTRGTPSCHRHPVLVAFAVGAVG